MMIAYSQAPNIGDTLRHNRLLPTLDIFVPGSSPPIEAELVHFFGLAPREPLRSSKVQAHKNSAYGTQNPHMKQDVTQIPPFLRKT
jgi:hypothetical protein